MIKKIFLLFITVTLHLSLNACTHEETVSEQAPKNSAASASPEFLNNETVPSILPSQDDPSKSPAEPDLSQLQTPTSASPESSNKTPTKQSKPGTSANPIKPTNAPISSGLNKGDSWQYIVMSDKAFKIFSIKNPNWFKKEFDASIWGTRNAPMGNLLNRSQEAMNPADQISWNDTSNNLLLRRSFNIDDPKTYSKAYLNICYDGEISIYVNGLLTYSNHNKEKQTTDCKYVKIKFDKQPKFAQGSNLVAVHLKSKHINKEFDMSIIP